VRYSGIAQAFDGPALDQIAQTEMGGFELG
jgi:hypothetical protein